MLHKILSLQKVVIHLSLPFPTNLRNYTSYRLRIAAYKETVSSVVKTKIYHLGTFKNVESPVSTIVAHYV